MKFQQSKNDQSNGGEKDSEEQKNAIIEIWLGMSPSTGTPHSLILSLLGND